MSNLNYYLLYGSNIPNCPAVILDDEMDSDEIIIEDPISDEINLIKTKFWEPYPKKPVMVDFHTDGEIDVISSKIYDVLISLSVSGIQMIPATILDPENKVTYDRYYYLHIYNQISCFDYDHSIYSGDKNLGFLGIVSKMVLDYKKLDEIPLKDRLVFRLEEMHTHQLFHESVVNAIMASDPQGIRFVKVEDYNAGAAFG